MRYFTITALLLFIVTMLSAQRRASFTHPDFEEITAAHKKVAILPIDRRIAMRPNELKYITPEELKEMERESGIQVQSTLESYFLNKKRRKGYQVKIQNVQETNRTLRVNNIEIDSLVNWSTSELCNLLGVDAIISGTMNTRKPVSQEVSLAIGLAFNRYLSTSENNLKLSLVDKSSEVLWKFQGDTARAFILGSNTTTAIFRRSARKLPYGQAR